MFPEQLKKILNLIKKTGDRVVIFDSNEPTSSYVVMDFDRYENMVGDNAPINSQVADLSVNKEKSPVIKDLSNETENLTEEDLTDKINREISVWKNGNIAPSLAEEDRPKKAWSIPSNVKNKAQEIE
ncbi:MAG: hypothetical protein ACOYL8_01455 [Patescibacteria group bacterium]